MLSFAFLQTLILSCYLIIKYLFILFTFFAISIISILIIAKYRVKASYSKFKNTSEKSITFVHPNCADCGGGEKVLWEIIKAIFDNCQKAKLERLEKNILNLNRFSEINKIYIISNSNGKDIETILSAIESIYNLKIDNSRNFIQLIPIRSSHMLIPKSRFTMLLQIIGQIIFSIEASLTIPQDTLLMDTTGLPFTYIIFYLFGFSISAYTHYPYISNDMINQVKKGESGYVHSRNQEKGVVGILKKQAKLIYYSFILKLYQMNGKILDFSFANSTWTYNHLSKIWGNKKISNSSSDVLIEKLFPPCGVEDYLLNNSSNIDFKKRERTIVSLGQFRPEKNHLMQIDILSNLIKLGINYKLLMIGGIRTSQDQAIVDAITDKAKSLNVEKYIELRVNAPYSDLKKALQTSRIGIHTMKDEHFGISVIELMASGVMTVAHNSAGPKYDIIGDSKECVGFLGESKFINNIYLN